MPVVQVEEEEVLDPTEEQWQILQRLTDTNDNILINALAGTGKTSTLKMMMEEVSVPVLYLAFNTAVVKEARETLPSGVEIKTCNSMGLKCWATFNGKAITDPKKMFNLVRQCFSELKGTDRQDAWDSYSEIYTAVSMSKHLGYIPDGKFPNYKRLCDFEEVNRRMDCPLTPFQKSVVDYILFTSIKAAFAGSIDFDDQVYMPTLFGGTFPRFPLVLIDEQQDLSPVNIALLKRLVKGRICGVGDRWQSIYYFRGAETNGVDKMKAMFNMVEMPLTVSFRCPRNVVEAVHWHVPHMKWNKEGGTYAELPAIDPDQIPEGSAIICRNNAPLFRAAYALLSRKRSVSVAGSDIGPKIIKLLGKIGASRDSREDLLYKIEAWKNEKLEGANNPATIHDTAECLKIFASWGHNLDTAVAYANHIFKQQGSIHLSTGHKAKGMEWETVYHLDPHLIRMDQDQDKNLKYVITTRAKENAFVISSKDLLWQ